MDVNPLEIQIINEQGQIVYTQKGMAKPGTNDVNLWVGDWSNGSYHSLIRVGNKYANEAFIIQH
jgi:hypothetical protein